MRVAESVFYNILQKSEIRSRESDPFRSIVKPELERVDSAESFDDIIERSSVAEQSSFASAKPNTQNGPFD